MRNILIKANDFQYHRYGGLNPINSLEGIQKDFTYWLDAMSFSDLHSYHHYITRLTALASQVDIPVDTSFINMMPSKLMLQDRQAAERLVHNCCKYLLKEISSPREYLLIQSLNND